MLNNLSINPRLYGDLTDRVAHITTECDKPQNYHILNDTINTILEAASKVFPVANLFTLKGTDYAYPGEFFERHNERNDAEDTIDIATMALYYATLKVVNDYTFADAAIINDFQVEVFEKEIEDHYEDSFVFNLVEYLLKNDVSYIEKMEQNSITIMDATFMLSWMTTLDNLDENIVSCMYKVINKAVSTKTVFTAECFPRFVEVLTTQKIETKGYPAFAVYKKAIGAGIKTKKDVQFLTDLGYTPLNIKELEFVLKKNCGNVSSLKTSRAIVSMLITLAETTEKFNEQDEKILANILSMGKLPNKLESGCVERIQDIVSYYDIEEKISTTNYTSFVTMLTKYHIVEYPTVDILKDDNFDTKISTLPNEVKKNNGDIISDYRNTIITKSVIDAINTTDTDYNKLEERARVLGITSFEELFSKKNHKFTTSSKFAAAVANGLIDVVKYANDEEMVDTYMLSNYFDESNSVCKLAVLKNTKLSVEIVINKTALDRPTSDAILTIVGSLSEQKEFIDIILERAITMNLSKFQNLFLNLIVYHSNEIKEIYNQEEVEELYQSAKIILSNMNGYGYGSFASNTSSFTSQLDSAYMSEEEKRQLAEKAEKERLERELADKKRKYDETRQKILAEMNDNLEYTKGNKIDAFKEACSYSSYRDSTKAKADIFLEIIKENACIKKNQISYVYELIGSYAQKGYFSFEQSKEIIASLTIVEEVMENNEEGAYA